MERRRFLQWGCAAGTAATLSPSLGWAQASGLPTRFTLTIEACDYEMIDGTPVYMVFYFKDPDHPHPALRVREGDTIEITIINGDKRPHGFAITGIPRATIASIPAGETAVSRFVAPVGGSYLYHDPLNAPVNRLLGLYGAFVVRPKLDTTEPIGSHTPFSRGVHTRQVRALFDELGRVDELGQGRFPGDKWVPGDLDRDKIWVFSQVDPLLNARVDRGEVVNGSTVAATFLPRYFHINGISGFDTGTHSGLPAEKFEAAHAIEPEGHEGQPTLIRTMNAGIVTHSPHIHGNSVFMLTQQAGNKCSPSTNIFEVDTWTLRPLGRVDVLLPFVKPTDIPNEAWPPKEEPFPLRYVMHCHTEMSQTAGGGNYPQGCVTHWEIKAPLGGLPARQNTDIRFDRTGVEGLVNFSTFGCNVFKGSPETPDRLTPDITIEREFRDGEITAPDGRKIPIWSLVDPRGGSDAVYPSPTMRMRVNQLVHSHLKAGKGPHTIHHHGMNPTTMNDGVGHVSMEVGEYTYQFQPSKPGTNFYHCHRNTVLHFEMGMFGLLIVDPEEGPGFLLNGQQYQVEKAWVADDMDPRWHDEIGKLGHEAGLCGEDVGLNRFDPKYFLLTGVFSDNTLTDPRAVIRARVGDTILIRLLNASYSILRTSIALNSLLIGVDGHSIRDSEEGWERSVPIPARQPFELTSAQRYALLIRPTEPGVFPVRMEFRHWVTRKIQNGGRGVINTKIVVT